MTKAEAMKALGNGNYIRVVTISACLYNVYRDILESCDNDDPYVYGTRVDGTLGGPFRRATKGETKWFFLKNVFLVG